MKTELYDFMFENEEMWIITSKGGAIIISDCSLMDC